MPATAATPAAASPPPAGQDAAVRTHAPLPVAADGGGETFPVFLQSDFSGEPEHFQFDLVRLEDRPEIPRAFPHRHDYYHLLWLTEAAGTHLLDFEDFPLREHTVFFVSPGQLHAWSSTVRPRGYIVNFSSGFFAQMFPRVEDIAQFPFFHIAGNTPLLHLDRATHDVLLPLVQEMEREWQGRGAGRLDIVRSYLLILLTRLRRCHAGPAADGVSPQGYSLTRRFQLLVERHYRESAPLRDYAGRLHVSERQLNEAVKRTLGKTAGQLVQDRLLLEAKRLLSNTDLGVATVAYQLNFDDLAYFCRFFKRHTGLTPGDFKRGTTLPGPAEKSKPNAVPS